jgi:hypothetical protein
MKTAAVLFLAMCYIVCACLPASAQGDQKLQGETPGPGQAVFTSRVQLIVDMPKYLQEIFTKCVRQELESLDGVALVNENPQYRITIMGIPNKTEQETMGFTFSILITRSMEKHLLGPFLMSRDIDDKHKILLMMMADDHERIEKNTLLTSSPDELGLVCKQIVAGFEVDLLSKDRAIWKATMRGHGQTHEQPSQGGK